jgi:hypothetical protein
MFEQPSAEPLSPDLAAAAPGLYAELGRSYPSDIRDGLAVVFGLVARAGASGEPLERTPGASYTPRPARVVKILRHECREHNPAVLAAALLACLDGEEHDAAGGDEAAALARAARTLAVTPGSADRTPAVERIVLASEVDRVRHLHMRGLSADELASEARQLESALLAVPAFPENERLVVLLRAWCSRATRP